MKLVLGGDSHAQCILAGLKRLAPAGFEIAGRSFGNGAHTYTQFFETRDGALHFTVPEYRANWRRTTGDDAVRPHEDWIFVFCLGLYSGPLFSDAMWIGYDPPGHAGDGDKITAAVLRAIVESKSKYIRAFYRALKERGAKVIAAPAPPPYRRHWCLKTRSPQKVAALHRAYLDHMGRFFDDTGVPRIPTPAESYSEDGFMHERFRVGIPEDDPHHANVEYGELIGRGAVDIALRF